MRNAKLLLQKLTELYPPSGAQRHNLTLADGLLEVTLFQDGLWYSFKFGDEELEDSVDTFVADIREAMDARLAGVANEPEVLRDLLSLVMPNPPEIEVIQNWTSAVKLDVTTWATTEMARASDYDTPSLPRPGVLG